VPTANVRNTCLGSAGAPGSLCNLSDYGQFITGTLTHGNAGVPFPDCINPIVDCEIPNFGTTTDDHVSDQAVAILSLSHLPLPNHTPSPNDPNCPTNTVQDVCDNYLSSGEEVFNADQFDGRADYNASSRLRLFGRYSFGQFYDNGTPAFGAQAGGPGADPSGFAGVARTRNQGISSGFTYTLSPKLLTDFRFGYFRYRLAVDAQDFGQTPAIGIPNIFGADTNDPFASGLPDFEIPDQQGLSFASGDYLRLGYSNQANDCTCPLREREQQFQFVSNWTLVSGRHTIKWGADLRFLQNYRFEADRPPTGFFSFAPSSTGLLPNANGSGLGLATFLIGDATSFDRFTGTPAAADAGERQKRFGFYGEDTWRINSRLTFNYGLRWEIYFPQTVTGTGGFLVPNLNDHDPSTTFFNTPAATNTAGGILGSWHDFAPRLGFGYLINPTTVIRAGYGRSFDAGYGGDIFGISATQNPPVAVDQNIQSTFNLATGPPQFMFPTGSRFSLQDVGALNSPANAPDSGAILYALPSRVRVPTVDSWNLTVQHELSSHLYFEVSYVGNKGTHVFPDADQPTLQTLGAFYLLSQPSLQNLIIPAPGPKYPNCKGGKNGVFPGPYCLAIPALRSFFNNVEDQSGNEIFNPNLFKVRYFGNGANDNYNSLQAKVSKTFSHGYSFLAHYTWSKGLDYDQDYFAVSPQYGPASFDIKHRFVMTNIWDLPLGRGKAWLGGIGPSADRFVGGWSISAITLWRSGLPFTPSYLQTNCAADTDTSAPCQPNLVAPVHISGSREEYFTTTGGVPLPGPPVGMPGACIDGGKFCGVGPDGQPVAGQAIGPWQRPGAGQIGDVGRNSFTGPGFFQADVGLAKVVFITEGTALRFRADAFNVFNKVNLGNPNACVDCTGGGAISALAPGALQRTLQFSVRFEF
jgi:TonB dependent receptor